MVTDERLLDCLNPSKFNDPFSLFEGKSNAQIQR